MNVSNMSDMSEHDQGQFVSVKEFAKLVDYEPRHVRRLIHEGRLQAFRIHEKGKWQVKKDQKIEASKLIQKRQIDAEEEYKEHKREIASELHKLIGNLRIAKEYGSVDGLSINEIIANERDRNRIHSIDPTLSRCLLEHVQVELPELTGIKEWGYLRPEDITDELLDKLSIIAYRRKFRGKCEICQGFDK